MASNLLAKAAKALKSQNERIRRSKIADNESVKLLLTSGTTLVAAGAAGAIDAKFGDGGAAEKFNVPVNAGAAAVLSLACVLPVGKARPYIAATAVGLGSGAIYRFAHDKTAELLANSSTTS